jgi:hypothetical protein
MLKRVTAFAAILAAGIIAGCGGGGGSAPTATVSGAVADGYLRGAEVFLDKNGNYQWDVGEPKATSGPGGVYTLDVAQTDLGKYPIVCRAVAGSTVDEDTGQTVQNGYAMSAPAGVTGFISPLTSIMREKMAASPGMTMAQAMAQLRSQFNLPADADLLGDYVAGSMAGPRQADYQTMRQTARQMAALMGQAAPLVMNGSGVYVNRYRGMMGEIDQNLPEIVYNAVSGAGMGSAFMQAMLTQMEAFLQSMPTGGGFMNYSGMFSNMTSHTTFWNYTGGRWQPAGMTGSGMM